MCFNVHIIIIYFTLDAPFCFCTKYSTEMCQQQPSMRHSDRVDMAWDAHRATCISPKSPWSVEWAGSGFWAPRLPLDPGARERRKITFATFDVCLFEWDAISNNHQLIATAFQIWAEIGAEALRCSCRLKLLGKSVVQLTCTPLCARTCLCCWAATASGGGAAAAVLACMYKSVTEVERAQVNSIQLNNQPQT